MPVNPANQELRRQLNLVAAVLNNAIEDCAEDFHTAVAHAEIAMTRLKQIVEAGKRANPERHT